MFKFKSNKIYKVFSRSNCERFCKQKHDKNSIIISIKSTHDKKASKVFCDEKNNVKAILFLSFDDIEQEDAQFTNGKEFCMSFEDGRKIAKFINEWYDKVDMIIVHCDGGISRSAGIAAAIMRVREGLDWPIFANKNKHPNMTCYLRTLKAFKYI